MYNSIIVVLCWMLQISKVMWGIKTHNRFKIYRFQLGPSKLWNPGSCPEWCPTIQCCWHLNHCGAIEEHWNWSIGNWVVIGWVHFVCLSHSTVLCSSFVICFVFGGWDWLYCEESQEKKTVWQHIPALWWLWYHQHMACWHLCKGARGQVLEVFSYRQKRCHLL